MSNGASPVLDILIVDDEAPARLRLATLIGDVTAPGARVAGEAASVDEALRWLDRHACDAVMLDIQMPGVDGMALAARLQARAGEGARPPAVVFVTAHQQHALRAFELEALDYLTKPVRRERLQAALMRVLQRRLAGGPAPRPDGLDTTDDDAEGTGLVVVDRGRVVRVPLQDVLYLKAELKYVTLRTAQRRYVLDETLNDLERRLGGAFLRVHRNAIVARRCVASLERQALGVERDEEAAEGWVIRVEPVGEWLAVSRRQLSAVREAIASQGI